MNDLLPSYAYTNVYLLKQLKLGNQKPKTTFGGCVVFTLHPSSLVTTEERLKQAGGRLSRRRQYRGGVGAGISSESLL